MDNRKNIYPNLGKYGATVGAILGAPSGFIPCVAAHIPGNSDISRPRIKKVKLSW